MEPRVAASGECGGGLGAVAPAVGDEGPQHVAVDDDDDDEADDVVVEAEGDDVAEVEESFEVVTFCVLANFKSLDLMITVAVAVVVAEALAKALSPTTSISSSSSIVERRDFVSKSFLGINCMVNSGVEEFDEDVDVEVGD